MRSIRIKNLNKCNRKKYKNKSSERMALQIRKLEQICKENALITVF